MKTNISFYELVKSESESIFASNYSEDLYKYLRDECILDQEGIKRVMPNLEAGFVNSHKAIGLTLDIKAVRDDKESVDEYKERMAVNQASANTLLSEVCRASYEATLSLLKGFASVMAIEDEKTYRRPRH